jgi:hypothetical protein
LSQRRFQALLARIVIDADFRDELRQWKAHNLGNDLTPLERERLVAAADSPGMEITRTLHKGWRLSKILTMLPMTHVLLGDELLARELARIWETHPPRGLYFREEAMQFCDHLQERLGGFGGAVPEVASFERAQLELLDPRAGRRALARRVRFRHDPIALLSHLAAGRRPSDVLERPCTLEGTVDGHGRIQWRVVEGTTSVAREDEGLVRSMVETGTANSELGQH